MSGESGTLLYKAEPVESGYNRIVGPGDSGLKLLEFGRISLGAGKQYTAATNGCEASITILRGSCSMVSRTPGLPDQAFDSVGRRSDVFSGNPDTLYLPRGTEFTVTGLSEEFHAAMFLCPARRDTQPMRVDGEDLERQEFGAANWRREACICLGNDADVDRLLVGETYNSPGNWSSYPPHKHDAAAPPEQPYEEIYFFTISPPQGFGIQRLYTAPSPTGEADEAAADTPGGSSRLDEVYVVEDGDTVVIPRGYHPVAAAPGYQLSYLWALAGEEREFGQWSDDPAHAWIRELE